MMNFFKSIFSLKSNPWLNTLLFLLSALALITPALINGFPLLHSDSGAYIYMGFINKLPVSRPITYCLFVRHISLSYSLWLVIILQAVIVTGIILLTIKSVLNRTDSYLLTFITIAILSSTTGLAVYTSQIMPDIFLSVALLGFIILLTGKKIPFLLIILLIIIIIAASLFHLSNPLVITTTMAGFIILYFIFNNKERIKTLKRNLIIALPILVFIWLAIPGINFLYGGGFRMSNSSNIVFFSRLLQSGIAQEYAIEKCKEDSSFMLCKYLNELPSYRRLDQFLWNDSSFLYDHPCIKTTWDKCWVERNEEFGRINEDIIRQPKYLKSFLKDAINGFFRQLVTFNMISYVPFGTGSNIDLAIQSFLKRDHQAHISAIQQSNILYFRCLSIIQIIIVLASFIFIILNYTIKKLRDKIPKPITVIAVITLLSLLSNALMTATFAVVVGRFQGRLIWLVPFIALLILYNLKINKSSVNPAE